MGIVIYSSEEEMPKHLRKEKQPEWNILDRMDWDEWNFVPTMTPQKSKFHNHVTWNSHRTDYFNKMKTKIAEEEAAKTRIAIDNKIGTAASYAQELKEAEEEEKMWEAEEAAEAEKAAEEAKAFEALQAELAKTEFTNTILPTPEAPEEYKPFTKQTQAQRAAKRKILNKKAYAKRKAEGKIQTTYKDAAHEFCEFCGGEFKDTPSGRHNHQMSQIHTTYMLRNNICKYYLKRHNNVKTMEQAEQVLANRIKESELSLCIKYTPTTLKNKYKRLWAQYSCNL